MSYKIYRADETSQVESYLVSIFDGTGSMLYEYEAAIAAYFEVFSDKRRGIKEFQFQFQSEVYDLLPYQGVNELGGNITTSLKDVFSTILENKQSLPKYLTILFVSDGREEFNLYQLREYIKEMKNNFSISFISLAVGSQFPLEISNNLRDQLHNQDPNIKSLFVIERSYRSQLEIKKDFLTNFVEIKKLITLWEGKLTLKQQVKQTIVSKPSNEVIPNSVFYTQNLEVVEYENGKKLEPSQKEEDVAQLIISSVQQAMIESKNVDIKDKMLAIQEEANEIIQNAPLKPTIDQVEDNKKLVEVLEFVDEVSDGNLNISLLTEDQKTKLQEAIISDSRSLKDESVKYVETVKNPLVLNQKILTDRISEQFKQVKAGCYVAGKIQKDLTQLEQAEVVMRNTLKNCIQIIEGNQQVDYAVLLTEFKDQTFISLNQVFKESSFKIDSLEQINMLKQMNDIFGLIQKIITKQVKPLEFIKQIRQIRQKQGIQQSLNNSATIFDSNEDFNYLPQELRLLAKEEIDQEQAQKLFILLVDCNQSMEKEFNLAIENFKIKFKQVSQDKKLIITWQNAKYQIIKEVELEQQQQQQQIEDIKFNTLFQCLQSVEQDYDLKNRKLLLCLVSDGETEYQRLHSEFKVAKFHYSIQFIYFVIGRKLFARIENELKQKFGNKNVKGAPELLNIPRQLIVNFNGNQRLSTQFNQKYEVLVKKIIQ